MSAGLLIMKASSVQMLVWEKGGNRQKMKGISFFDVFQCINKDCPFNCCGGWQIEVDEETYEKYQQEPREFGKTLRRNISVRNVPQIRQHFGKCPYLTKDKLCGMYLTHGEAYMTFACRMFPRRKVSYTCKGETMAEETYLELSCPEAARLFVETKRPLLFQETFRETETCWNFEIEEMAYYKQLLKMRDTIVKIVYDREIPFTVLQQIIYEYTDHCQQSAMRLNYDEITAYSEIILEPSNLSKEVSRLNRETVSLGGKGSTLHKLMTMGIEQVGLAFRNPKMGKLLKMYYRFFNQDSYEEVGAFMNANVQNMLSDNPELEIRYRNYLVYFIHQQLMFATYSYNMTKPVIMAIIYTQLLLLFDVCTWYRGKKTFSVEKQIENIYCLQRTSGYSEEVADQMYAYLTKNPEMSDMIKELTLYPQGE